MRDHTQAVIDAHEPTVDALLQLLSDFSDPSRRAAIVASYSTDSSCTDKSEAKKARLGLGYLSQMDILNLLLKRRAESGANFRLNAIIILRVIERLKRFGLVTESDYPGLDEFRVPENSMMYFHQYGLDRNIVFGPAYTITNLARAVPAINVRCPSGDLECGSGIILRESTEISQAILLTNRHVLEGREVVEVKTEDGPVEITSSPFIHESADLAAFKVHIRQDVPTVPLDDDPPVLTPVIAMGYPRIPTASGQFLMAHRGEINGVIKTLFGERYLAISCVVSPGNSGGPIITEAGFCAGIVTQSGIGEFGTSDQPTGIHRVAYHMAIPPDVVSTFIASIS